MGTIFSILKIWAVATVLLVSACGADSGPPDPPSVDPSDYIAAHLGS